MTQESPNPASEQENIAADMAAEGGADEATSASKVNTP